MGKHYRLDTTNALGAELWLSCDESDERLAYLARCAVWCGETSRRGSSGTCNTLLAQVFETSATGLVWVRYESRPMEKEMVGISSEFDSEPGVLSVKCPRHGPMGIPKFAVWAASEVPKTSGPRGVSATKYHARFAQIR